MSSAALRLGGLCRGVLFMAYAFAPWSAQDRGERRDRFRSSIRSGSPLAIRERLASSAPASRIGRSSSLMADATVRARPIRPSRRPCTRVTCRRARGVRDGTVLGTIAHGVRSSGVRARQRPPLTRIARPASACSRKCR